MQIAIDYTQYSEQYIETVLREPPRVSDLTDSERSRLRNAQENSSRQRKAPVTLAKVFDRNRDPYFGEDGHEFDLPRHDDERC